MNERFEEIRKSGRLIYEYVRGSHAYGLNTPQSDIDTGGVYVAETDEVLGLRAGYKEQISDSKSDNVWYEVGRFLELCLNSNPNMLEALFIPERCVRYCAPEMKLILEHREKFLSKKAFNALCGYAIEQIKKARGLNKKIVEPILERKTPIDFCWTNWGQGSIEVTKYLEMHGLKQIYCGLVDVPNIRGGHGVYYDWGQHIHMEWKTEGEFMDYYHAYLTGNPSPFIDMLKEHCLKDYPGIKIGDIYKTITPKGYHGIQKEDGSSNELHLDSVVKDEMPIFNMVYNEDGYKTHCRKYKEQKDWEKNRNPVRYESNLDKNYDAKNIMHSVRLIQMGIELAKYGKFNVDRNETGDRDFLLKIRNHGFEYEYIVDYAEKKREELNEAIKNCTLPDEIDREFVNELLLKIRKLHLNS